MARHKVALFRQYPFTPGQEIRIEDGPRKGDWQVLAADTKTMKLRCPISGREFDWKPFCYFAEEQDTEWPAED